MCEYCEVNFFGRVHKNDAGMLAHFKEFLCTMTEKVQARHTHSRQAVIMRYCLKKVGGNYYNSDTKCDLVNKPHFLG